MTVFFVGDAAISRSFEGPLADANARSRACAESIRARDFDGVLDVVPAARSVTVLLAPGVEPSTALLAALDEDHPPAPAAGRDHVLRVAYGGADLADVARAARLSEDEVVRLHSSAEYTVAFLGFTPGFGYLIGLPPALEASRLATPRTAVEAGSVGIAGVYTGVYPRATPGGWLVIGRTDAELFDPARGALLHAGDRVRFSEA